MSDSCCLFLDGYYNKTASWSSRTVEEHQYFVLKVHQLWYDGFIIVFARALRTELRLQPFHPRELFHRRYLFFSLALLLKESVFPENHGFQTKKYIRNGFRLFPKRYNQMFITEPFTLDLGIFGQGLTIFVTFNCNTDWFCELNFQACSSNSGFWTFLPSSSKLLWSWNWFTLCKSWGHFSSMSTLLPPLGLHRKALLLSLLHFLARQSFYK